MSLKTFLVHVVNEQEITMKIKARNIEDAKEMIETGDWADYIEDYEIDDEDLLVSVEASKGFRVEDKPWKVKTIKETKAKGLSLPKPKKYRRNPSGIGTYMPFKHN